MIAANLDGMGLFDALNLCEFTLATGTLTITGGALTGSVQLHLGALSYAEIEGREEIGLERWGIGTELWRRSRAEGEVVSGLLDRGSEPAAIRSFVLDRLHRTIADLAGISEPHISFDPRPGWFGHELTFPVGEVIEGARIINFGGSLVGDGDQALVALCPATTPVTIPPEHWNLLAAMVGAFDLDELRRTLGMRPATDLVRFLQTRGLATAVLSSQQMMSVEALDL